MAYNKFFGHESPDGRHHDARVAAFDRSALVEFSAENVAMVEVIGGRWNLKRNAVDRLHGNLMDSPGHRANILNPDITDVAMGVVRTESGVWVTQVFVELSGSLPARGRARCSWRRSKSGRSDTDTPDERGTGPPT